MLAEEEGLNSPSEQPLIQPKSLEDRKKEVENALHNVAKVLDVCLRATSHTIEERIHRQVGSEWSEHFRAAWRKVDPYDSGYIYESDLSRLLRELPEPFSMAIYEDKDSVGELVEEMMSWGSPAVRIDLGRLNERIKQIDFTAVKRRRQHLRLFCHEVFATADADKMISRDNLLVVMSHYCLRDAGLQ